MEPATRSKIATGLMLIVLGLGLYGLQYLGAVGRPLVLITIGGLFFAAYFATRSRLLLIHGGVLAGLGVGIIGGSRWLVWGEFTLIGLAGGFLLIWLLPVLYERRSHWWPLVPSLVLFLLGFHAWRRFRQFVFSARGWPILIVIIGALILLGALGRGRRGDSKRNTAS